MQNINNIPFITNKAQRKSLLEIIKLGRSTGASYQIVLAALYNALNHEENFCRNAQFSNIMKRKCVLVAIDEFKDQKSLASLG